MSGNRGGGRLRCQDFGIWGELTHFSKNQAPDTSGSHFKVLFVFQIFILNESILQNNSQNYNQLLQLQYQPCGPVWAHPARSSNWEAFFGVGVKDPLRMHCLGTVACLLFELCFFFNILTSALKTLNSTLSTLFFSYTFEIWQVTMFSIMKS